MTKALHRLLMTTVLLTLVSVCAVTSVDAQGVLQEIKARMDKHNRALQSLVADVSMVKTDSALKVSDTTVGSTSYLPATKQRVMYVRIDWKTQNGRPFSESIAVIGDRYEIWQPRLNQVISGKTDKAKNNASAGGVLGFMGMSKAQMDANFKITYIGAEQVSGGVRTQHLLLTPKTAVSYKSAELWVDDDGMPRQAKIIEKNDDSTTVLLTNIKKNETIAAVIFKLKYPDNAKKIKA